MSEFVEITKQEFEKFLPNTFNVVDNPQSKEIIYDIPTQNPQVSLRIYSSIDVNSGVSRNLGEDAIRCVLFDENSNKPIDKGKRTHRMANWKERLKEKLEQLSQEVNTLKFCKSCNSIMVLRDGKFGKFYSCIRYPLCMTIMDLNGKFKEKIQSIVTSPEESQLQQKIVKCPKCDAPMKKRSGARGEFYGCTNFTKTGCRGTRQVNQVEMYGQGVEKQQIQEIEEEILTENNGQPEIPINIDILEDDSKVKLIETSKFPFLTFKFEKFNPVQSRVFKFYDQDVNVVIAAATSAGKTVVAELFMSQSISQGKKAIFLSPLKAVSQEKYDDWTNPKHDWSKLKVSIVTGDYQLTDRRVQELNEADVVVMTNEMLDSRTRRIETEKNDWLLKAGTVVCDECFLGGIHVTIENNISAPIKEIYENNNITHILSYNEENKILEKKKILRKIRKILNDCIVSIRYKVNNKIYSISCTPNHKIWTEKGYKKADELKEGDILKIFPVIEDKTCYICDKEFKTRTLFLKHYFKEHFRKERFFCKKCNKEFYRKNDFVHHINYVHKNKFYKCENCKRKYKNKNSLELHKKRNHQNVDFNCNFCIATFSNEKSLKSHIRFEHNFFDGDRNKKEILRYNRNNETLELWMKSKNIKITKFEKKIIELNNENIIYTGNHSFWLTLGTLKNGKLWKKNPDFKIKHQKKVIEVGDIHYWHTKEEIKQVIQGYKNIGYKCLYLIGEDLEENRWNKTIKRIDTFIKNHDGMVISIKKWGSEKTQINKTYIYNLEIENNHNYIAKNVLVSNCHLLMMKGRGDKVESAMMRFSKQNPDCRIVFLSATMPNVSQLAKWLTSLNNKKTELINSGYRPCQLDVNFVTYSDYGKYAEKEESKIRTTIQLTQEYSQDKFIVFVHAKATGRIIEARLKQMGENVEMHMADLNLSERNKVTEGFRDKDGIRIIVATSTLAWGINLPARRVIVVGVHRGLNEVEPLDIKQEVGRAGRVGFDPKGDAYILIPESKATFYKKFCTNIPPINSTMNDPDTLAFHIISEIEQKEIYNVETLMTWYNRSLAAFQNNFLDRVDAETLLEKLEKIKAIEQKNEIYRVTKLGMIAAHLYFSPYTICGWWLNFSKIIQRNIIDDVSIAWALGNIQENNKDFIPKDNQDYINNFKSLCIRKQLPIETGPSVKASYFYACLTNSDEVAEITKGNVKFDIERNMTAIGMIDQRYANWHMEVFWKKLLLRIQYEISEEQTELCSLKGIGGKRVRELFNNDIKTIIDFKEKRNEAIFALESKTIYEKILQENNL